MSMDVDMVLAWLENALVLERRVGPKCDSLQMLHEGTSQNVR